MQSSSDVFGQARPCKAGAGNLVVMRIRMEVRMMMVGGWLITIGYVDDDQLKMFSQEKVTRPTWDLPCITSGLLRQPVFLRSAHRTHLFSYTFFAMLTTNMQSLTEIAEDPSGERRHCH